MIRPDTRTAIVFFALLALPVVVYAVYTPGLAGTFLFDDYVNLPSLGQFGPVDKLKTLLFYVTSGNADPIGRPLSMLSFLLDAQNWPADAAQFKRTNILLHALNGMLLCWLLLELGRLSAWSERRACGTALLGAAIWLLHPLWLSTTLYIVQREAMLPATFTLAGLIGYLKIRRSVVERRKGAALLLVITIALFTLLATLSKANGILFPVFIAVLEIAYLRPLQYWQPSDKRVVMCLRIASYPAAALIAAYLLYAGATAIIDGLAIRPWTEWQRLITEPRVICDYLGLLIFPHPYSRGLFNDSFLPSGGLLSPWTTLPAILAIVALAVFAWRMRNRFPPVSLAIFFFLVGHSIESTTIPLELYFEHRNYLPAALLFWPVAVWLTGKGALKNFKPALVVLLLVLLSAETYAGAQLWGDSEAQALVWASQNPDSPRAQTYASQVERGHGRNTEAEKRLRNALGKRPEEIQLAVNLLGARCELGEVSEGDVKAAEFAIENGSNRGPLMFDWLSTVVWLAHDNACRGLTPAVAQRLIDAAWKNRQAASVSRFRQDLFNLEGQLAIANGNNSLAAMKFTSALAADPKAEVALQQAGFLASHGLPQLALDQLNSISMFDKQTDPPKIRSMISLHEWLLYRDRFWSNEATHMRKTLEDDLHTRAAAAQ